MAPDADELMNVVKGLDSDLSADECLRALSYIFDYRRQCSVEDDPRFYFREATQQHVALELPRFGFRRLAQKPLKLTITRLQACVWFACRVIFDIQQRRVKSRSTRGW